MKRERLIEIVSAAAIAQGYAFHTGEEHLANSTVRVYPAVWLAPPVVKAHIGRAEGETTWHLTLHLMTLPTGAAQAEAVWQTLERDALEIAGTIAMSTDVCAIANVGCTPARQSLTAHGETSVAMGMDVTVWFSHES
jgi:hypothetical protein